MADAGCPRTCRRRWNVCTPWRGPCGTSGQRGLSLIVGLGDYAGGALGVEDAIHDIRYRPLEFDGYTQRHNAEEFEGEHYTTILYVSSSIHRTDETFADYLAMLGANVPRG